MVHGVNHIPADSLPNKSDDKYSMVQDGWKIASKAQDRLRTLTAALDGTPSGCRLPHGTSRKIDQETQESRSLEYCLVLLYHTYG
jgi:hypothetical protein